MKRFKILLVLLLFWGCQNKPRIIYSPGSIFCITQYRYKDVLGRDYTVFYYGKVEKGKTPDKYIIVKNDPYNSWHGLLSWNGAEVTFFQPYSYFEGVNLSESNMIIETMDSPQFFFSLYFDKLPNDYIKIGIDIK